MLLLLECRERVGLSITVFLKIPIQPQFLYLPQLLLRLFASTLTLAPTTFILLSRLCQAGCYLEEAGGQDRE